MVRFLLRKNFVSLFADQEKAIRGKIAFKTQNNNWANTPLPVVILISIHSVFHEGKDGDLKMNALISTIKENVIGPVTVLLCEGAHIYARSLYFENDLGLSCKEGKQDSEKLVVKYQKYFGGCEVAFWDSYISQDESYEAFLKEVKAMQAEDPEFRSLLELDAKSCYTIQRMQEGLNEELFIEKTVEDLILQNVCLLILSKRGTRFQFYPGRPCLSAEYINQKLLPEEKRVEWVSVNLSIEEKTILNHVEYTGSKRLCR